MPFDPPLTRVLGRCPIDTLTFSDYQTIRRHLKDAHPNLVISIVYQGRTIQDVAWNLVKFVLSDGWDWVEGRYA